MLTSHPRFLQASAPPDAPDPQTSYEYSPITLQNQLSKQKEMFPGWTVLFSVCICAAHTSMQHDLLWMHRKLFSSDFFYCLDQFLVWQITSTSAGWCKTNSRRLWHRLMFVRYFFLIVFIHNQHIIKIVTLSNVFWVHISHSNARGGCLKSALGCCKCIYFYFTPFIPIEDWILNCGANTSSTGHITWIK